MTGAANSLSTDTDKTVELRLTLLTPLGRPPPRMRQRLPEFGKARGNWEANALNHRRSISVVMFAPRHLRFLGKETA